MKQSFTSGEAAKLCGLGLTTLKRWVNRGALKAYRTPGGAMRIMRGDLMDFMRAYDIPMHRLENSFSGKLLICLSDSGLRRQIIEAAVIWGGQIEISEVESEFDLGFAIASNRPDFIIIEGRDPEGDLEQARSIRKCLRPHSLRIGVVCDYVAAGRGLGTDAPEVAVNPATDTQWAEVLLANLFSGVMTETGSRRAG
ncbi:MAG: excisionase family DNA-binding protein [Planctomycetes bacterium]|nr:excisionase family DNA-binding protein [Planctomycetota bacterium]